MTKLFENISDKNIEKLKHFLKASTIKYQKNVNILSNVNQDNYIAIVDSGSVQLGYNDYNGNKIIIENLNQGDLISTITYSLKGEEFEHGKCEICLGKFNILDKQNYFLECGCIIHNKCFDNFIINCIEQNIPFSDIICPLCNKIIIPIDFIITSLTNSKRNDTD